MDTILNLGLNEVTVQAIAKNTGNLVFAYDSYRRFIQMFSDVVAGIRTPQPIAKLEAKMSYEHFL